ncbi:putative phage integrase/recombinase [Mizugakiibacter sediminis]|uniref:Putative phage integrase/recombinase n=1 Tax=Mizugakiibacter sediminis TaxID=1475481 RepID=A0A0K8QN72_9GAMM|nr:putative phage integrase/recombinase [Mizugakiibacter sediminis]
MVQGGDRAAVSGPRMKAPARRERDLEETRPKRPSDSPAPPAIRRGGSGGRYRDRTCDPYHVKVVLYR